MDGEDLLNPSLPTAVFPTTQLRSVQQFVTQPKLHGNRIYRTAITPITVRGNKNVKHKTNISGYIWIGGGGVRPKELLALVSEQCPKKSLNTTFRAEVDIP